MPSGGAPEPIYEERLGVRQREFEREDRVFNRLANARLVAFLLILALLGMTFFWGWAPWWILMPTAAFVFLLGWHARVAARRRSAERGRNFYERGLDRLREKWAGKGESGQRFLDLNHPYAADLDLFGAGSLFELLCTARTRSGEETLAAWLLAPATPAVIRDRQAAVQELRPQLQLREDLAVLGDQVRTEFHPNVLAEWGDARPVLTSRIWRWATNLLVIVTVGAAIAWWGLDLGYWPLVGCLAVEGLVGLLLMKRVKLVLHAIEDAGPDLALLTAILGLIERHRFETAALLQLRQRLTSGGMQPSRALGELQNLIDWLHADHNQFVKPIGLMLLWHTRHAFAIDAWRQQHGHAIAEWLAVIGEFEALSALATYAYEHPADPFPDVVEQGTTYDGMGLGHPLLPAYQCIRNNVTLGDPVRMLIVSGSNMSGKSTLLRTVGINAVLALAGAPVRATSLRLSPLEIGATLRIQDSLQAGKSRFYAEITRIRQLVDLAQASPPLLFLLDEIFHGTNSHDRRHGAAAILKGLLNKGAIGLVTTHDLALTDLVEQFEGRANNVHFADHLDNGEMVFDYVMRPGVTTHSNALALMRAVGLEV